MASYKYGFSSSIGVDQAKAEAMMLASAASHIPTEKLEAEDITSPDHQANNEILIRVTEKPEE
jgi:hypothetical protein